MKNLQSFEEFLNEKLNESFDSDKVTRELWKKALPKFEKYVIYDEHKRGTIRINSTKLGDLFEEAINREIKKYKDLSFVSGFSNTPTTSEGYGGKSTTWRKMIQNENKSMLTFDMITNDNYHYPSNTIPFRPLSVNVYGKVTVNSLSRSVGGGVYSDKTQLSNSELDDISINISKYIIKNFELAIIK